jgi:SAM-dependent methyltransferase
MPLCPICNHPSPKLKYDLSFDVYECEHCGYQFCRDAVFDKSFLSSLDEASRYNALKGLRYDNFQKVIEAIQKYKTHSFAGIEIGSGHGWFLEMCKDSNIECEGIEPETHFNDNYKKAGVHVINGFYPDVVPINTTYNFIAFNDVFEHLPSVGEVMKVNHSLLKPDGILIISLPVQSGLVYFLSKIAYRFGVKSLLNRMWQFNFHSPHLSYFTKKNIVDLAEKNGFQKVESFPLKTINISEVSDRVSQDNSQGAFSRFVSIAGAITLYPFFQLFPDTCCFVFRKQ